MMNFQFAPRYINIHYKNLLASAIITYYCHLLLRITRTEVQLLGGLQETNREK